MNKYHDDSHHHRGDSVLSDDQTEELYSQYREQIGRLQDQLLDMQKAEKELKLELRR